MADKKKTKKVVAVEEVVDLDAMKASLQADVDTLGATVIAATEAFNAAKANAENVEQRAIAVMDRSKPEAIEEMAGHVKDAINAFKM